MTSQVPFVRQETNWLAAIPRLLLIAILAYCFYPLNKEQYLLIAIVAHWLVTLALRQLCFPRSLHQGIRLIRQERFEEAIPFVERTVNFYTRYRWIDKYRYVLMISSSRSTFQESCLNNLGYCYLQAGEIVMAREIYEAVLQQFPRNKNARAMLGTIAVFAAGASLN